MKSWASGGHFAACILMWVAFIITSNAEAAVGRTQGSYSVTPSGAATYTIPIWGPPGPNGLQPAISLVYNSQTGSGPLGIGWSLSGLSSITRCDQTYAQNTSTVGPVTLTTNDIYCLDGQELRLTGGTYGAPASTYQTEVANFENVTAVGTAGSGPASFTVKDRNGRTYEYGNGGGSQVLAAGTSTPWTWWLDKVTDPAGNTMTITYDNANGTAVPNVISWTPSAYGSTVYNYTMSFAYGTNAPASSTYGYVAGTAWSNTNLLTSISINYSGATVKKYVLTYQLSPTTGRDELTQVQECADAAQTNCLAPTVIHYQSGSAGVSATGSTLNLGTTSQPWYLAGYDVNGDGYKDLIYQVGTTWYVAFGSATGYGTPINTGIVTPAYTPGKGALLVGDLLANGHYGLLARSAGGTGTNWHYWTWNGTSFSESDTGVAYDTTAASFALADINGDGLPDLVSLNLGVSGFQAVVHVQLKDVGGLTFEPATVAYTNNDNLPDQVTGGTFHTTDVQHAVPIQKVDINGDGRDDLVLHLQFFDAADHIHYPGSYILLANGTSFTATTTTFLATTAYFLNWNDDGCTDLLSGSSLYISECNGATATTITLPVAPLAAIDWNGDGRTDVLYQSAGTLYVAPSNGQGLGAGVSTGIAYNSAVSYAGADINGDGLDDLLTESLTAGTMVYNLHNSVGQKPDLLSSLTDGYGNFVKPTYVSLANSLNSTYFEDNNGAYPNLDYVGPFYVVNQTTFSDASTPPNGAYQVDDFYAGAWMNLQGRGFVGFRAHQTHDLRNGIWETRDYDKIFPYIGMLTADVATQNNTPAKTIFSRNYTLADTVLDSTQSDERDFPHASAYTENDYEVGGPKDAALITAKTASYSYDDFGNLTVATQTVTDKDSGSPYFGDSWTTTTTNTPDVNTGTWCLGLLSETRVSYTASNDEPSVTRTRSFTPDLTHCRYTQVVTEPLSSNYMVTETLGYDSFGNIDSDTMTGVNMVARLTTADWGATGQFPMSVTDAGSETTQFNYDFRYGLASSQTDPNGLITSWQYGDGFGRVTEEVRPDNTLTTWSYSLYSGADPIPRMHIIEAPHDSAGNVISETAEFLDPADRLYVEDKTQLDGTLATVVSRTYDSLGRIAADQVPYEGAPIGAVSYHYDALNRLTEVQRPISQSDSVLQSTTYGYEGRTTTITDPQGHARTLVHDVNGWLRETQDALGYSVTLGYDAAGAKTAATDSLGHSLWAGTYAYGLAPYLTGETDIDRGSWGYTVDALGERTAWTDAKAQHFSETYDALSRPLTRTEPDLFTQWTWGSSAASFNVGKLQNVCSGTGTTCAASANTDTFTYDNKGRLSTRVTDFPLWGVFTTTWQYNATTGFLDTLTYPHSAGGSFELKYAYQNGFLQSITDVFDSPNVTIWTANAQNAAGQVTQETLGNGLVTSRAYDAVTHWLQSVQSGPGGGASIQNQSFLYDEVGNVTQRQDNIRALTENFYYDNDDRLSYSTLNGTQNLSLTYDPMGNITSRSDVAGGATWTYDPAHVHQVTQAGSAAYQYVYDANGNVKTRQGVTIGWSSYNYPTLFHADANGESVTLGYDDHRHAYRVQTNGSLGLETIYHVDDGLFDVVSTSAGIEYRHYVYADGKPVAIASRKSSGVDAIYYLLSDHQGSISAITNSAGAVVVGESFAAYGGRRNPTTWSGAPSSTDLATIAGITRHGYTYHSALGSLMGLNYMIGRVQDAVTGRFLAADPTMPSPLDPQSYNSYSYVTNNPLTYVDPTGFCSLTTTANSDGTYTYHFVGCNVTATPEPAPPTPTPGICISCFYNPTPVVPPSWPGGGSIFGHNPPSPKPQQTKTGVCSPAGINAAAGAAAGAVAGGAALAELGPVGVAVGGIVGGVMGGVAGYFSTNTLANESGLGAVAAAGSSGVAPVSGVIGGAVGGAATYAAQQAGAPDAVSVPVGGALGGAVGGALAPSIDGAVGGVAAGAAEGGAIGAAAGATAVAVAAGLHALCGS